MPLVTWNMSAVNSNYSFGPNWSAATPPGFLDAAIFGISSQTSILMSSNIDVGVWVFTREASNYSFTLDPSFAYVKFIGGGVVIEGGSVRITLDGNDTVEFHDGSSAGLASITNDIGQLVFEEVSTAGSANIANGSQLFFENQSTAGAATVHTTVGGYVEFDDFSTGGNANFTTDAGGKVDFSPSVGPAGNHVITVGSIAGAGIYFLGANQLIVGSNGQRATVSGPIEDSGIVGGSGASLVKVGNGRLTLSGAGNTYSGGTTIERGTLDLGAVGAAGTGALTFAGNAKATLRIGNAAFPSHVFGNLIDFFGKHDVLDLNGLKFHAGATATYHKANDHLTVRSGHVTDTLTLLSPHGTHFEAVSDHHGGTEVFLVFA